MSGVLTMGSAQGGLWMLLALGLLVMSTGLPVWALLLGVSSVAAAVGAPVAPWARTRHRAWW